MAKSDTRRDASSHTPLDRRLAEVAARQHGVVSLSQLRPLGLSASGVRNRVAVGRLHRVHRGVYAVGHTSLSPDGHQMAAVLTGGPEGTLFQRSAAALLSLRPTGREAVDIATPTRRGRTRPRIIAHAAKLHPSDRTAVRGIPCTSVARTLLDCAEVIDRRSLERMVERAEILRTFDLTAVRAVLGRGQGRHGAALLDAVLRDIAADSPPTRNDFEREFLRLCEEAQVPPPQVNAPRGGVELDFLWPEHRLIVETDGYETHGTRQASSGIANATAGS